ncbi:MAG: hypothetical protein IPL78_26020 [Chloroflexi bacterium]|nr:hypothetical protein [Chloroflexota bacterium]
MIELPWEQSGRLAEVTAWIQAEFLRMGMPDRRLGALPGLYDELMEAQENLRHVSSYMRPFAWPTNWGCSLLALNRNETHPLAINKSSPTTL